MLIGVISFSAIVILAGAGFVLSSKKEDSGLSYLRAHADEFRVKNNGTSLDKREIYSLSLDDLGMSGK